MTPSEIIREAQRLVARFEDPVTLEMLLERCNAEEVLKVTEVTDPIEFAARVYGLVRPAESAAATHSKEEVPLVQEAGKAVKHLIAPIQAMRERVEELTPTSELERAGKEYLLDRFGWALWILQERLPGWGY